MRHLNHTTFVFALLSLSWQMPGVSAATEGERTVPSTRPASQYRFCLELIKQDPTAALSEAEDWMSNDGGPSAKHCAALALVDLQQYEAAATQLEALARDPQVGSDFLRSEIFGQAGNAWMLLTNGEKAVEAFSLAITFDRKNHRLYYDRARANALQKNWSDVEKDISKSLDFNPTSPDAYTLRATARRELSDLDGASDDVEHALTLEPTHLEAILERGQLRATRGNTSGAREDWLFILNLAPGSAAGAAAQAYLHKLDLKIEDSAPVPDAPATPDGGRS